MTCTRGMISKTRGPPTVRLQNPDWSPYAYRRWFTTTTSGRVVAASLDTTQPEARRKASAVSSQLNRCLGKPVRIQ